MGIDHWQITDGNGTRIESTQHTDAIIEQNKAMLTHNDGYSPSRELRRVASIPYILGLKWLNEEGWWFMDPANADKLAAKLNSSDYADLRTAPGRVGVSNGAMH